MNSPIQPRKLKERPLGIDNCWKCVNAEELCDPHRRILVRYKLTRERYLKMLATGCGVCGKLLDTNGAQLVVDHDHSCCPGKNTCGECVRGLLCTRHNIMAGFLEAPDATEVREYLNEWNKGKLQDEL